MNPMTGRKVKLTHKIDRVTCTGTVVDSFVGHTQLRDATGWRDHDGRPTLVYSIVVILESYEPKHYPSFHEFEPGRIAFFGIGPGLHWIAELQPESDPPANPMEPPVILSSVIDALAKAGVELGRRRETWRGGMAGPEVVLDPMGKIGSIEELGVALKAARPAAPPTFNHTRGDGPENPCPECLKAMTRSQLIEYIQDLEQQLKDEMT